FQVVCTPIFLRLLEPLVNVLHVLLHLFRAGFHVFQERISGVSSLASGNSGASHSAAFSSCFVGSSAHALALPTTFLALSTMPSSLYWRRLCLIVKERVTEWNSAQALKAQLLYFQVIRK